jgi:ferritin-like metal-binding protein YciE
MKLESLNTLYVEGLADIYSAEKQLISALPKLAKAAHHSELSHAFQEHLKETEMQVERLETIFSRLDQKPPRVTCKAMKGLIDEGSQLVGRSGDPAVIDAGLISAAQRVEHYEIAAYGCARTFAELLGERESAAVLNTSLDEEKAADKKLNNLAKAVINVEAKATSMSQHM